MNAPIRFATAAAALALSLVTLAANAQQSEQYAPQPQSTAVSSSGNAADDAYGPSMMNGRSQSGSANVPPAPGKTQRNPQGVYFGN